jgi:hypothetical protein
MSRDKAIAFAEEKALPIDVTKKSPYSIDQNLWGRAVETGFLEDIWNAPIEDVYDYTADPATPRDADEVVITFDRGTPVAIDGRAVTMLEAVLELNKRAGAQGVGRLDLVEDRLVGIKSREVYEAPGAITLITAHQELENGHRRAGPVAVQEVRRPAVGRAGLRRPVVLAAEAGPGRLRRRGQRARDRRRPADPARRPGRRDRPAQRAVALRVRDGDVRLGRRLRPDAGQGLRRALGPAQQDGRPPRRRATPAARERDRVDQVGR